MLQAMLDDGLRSLIALHGVGETRSGGILIVDDERPNLTVLRNFLDSGYRVHEAQSGAEALEIAKVTDLDVVITDQRMPQMTGIELLEALRDLKPDVAGIVLTGFTDPPALISAINRARVFRFLKKPWQPDDILEAVRQASEHVYQTRAIQKLVSLLAHRTEELDASLGQVKSTQRQLLHMERLGTMGRLASGVVHDLRNLMVSLGYVEGVLAQRKIAPDVLESVQVGLQGVGNLVQTLEAMHAFARGGGLSLDLAKIPGAAAVQDAVAISRMDLNFRMHKVAVNVPDGLPQVHGDRQKLTQVLVNLIRNALQATPQWKHVNIGAARAGNQIIYSVEDEGPGVPVDLKENLFKPFVSTKGENGLGMGLYMAKLIVDSHQGEIAVLDRPQGGARFEVKLHALSEA
ncbi:MAG TPA: hybrid sensor histidine kinase/response regulator [Myxococcales bacterium]|nr:hybrid sensor histidine kinase/response regulator [Myxococcales bacterium]